MTYRAWIAPLLIATVALAACSDDSDGSSSSGDTSTDTSTDTGTGTGTATGTGTGTDTGTATGTGTGTGTGTSAIVINEIAAASSATPFGDWIELYNAGDTAFDLSGFGLADTDNATSGPKLGGEELRFPAGTMLEPGDYLVAIADQDITGGPGPYTACGSLVASCYYAGWGATDNGETIFLVDADDAILTQVTYPALDANVGQTWGRLPSGAGDFDFNTPTAGAENEPVTP
ncbi:lamin tail domain-containing protein [Chondromyces apiculatus]|uniref:Period n=1 Tax=Chondromyces apiculatus DSM 436 TaxID=1192034 RepID=A0A017TCZ9_9BACT|nr:lamin tail domain-containing protein [Chondromyces apiculatus]EYF07089.1 period [Chondromyces apiculatus DSM 436]